MCVAKQGRVVRWVLPHQPLRKNHTIRTAAAVLPAGPDATNELFNSIQNVIMRALLAVQPVMINDKHSFEVSPPAAAAMLLLSWTFCSTPALW
jgi:hypothetical protein